VWAAKWIWCLDDGTQDDMRGFLLPSESSPSVQVNFLEIFRPPGLIVAGVIIGSSVIRVSDGRALLRQLLRISVTILGLNDYISNSD
jgi:hypothetical protein